MHTARCVGTPAFDNPFTAWAQFDVQFLDQPSAMRVVRIDRLGLTIVAADDAALPPIGLPRRALIVSGSTDLCELRLVARTAIRADSGATELIVQPSRANDHTSLWRVLRARQMQENAVATHRDTCLTVFPKEASASPLQLGRPRMQSWCDASFNTASRRDAPFFACWLDYHFAEIQAYARIALPAAQLSEVVTRTVSGEVETRFVFSRFDDSLATVCTEMLCRWIRAEAARQLDMSVEHWLGASSASGCSTHLAA